MNQRLQRLHAAQGDAQPFAILSRQVLHLHGVRWPAAMLDVLDLLAQDQLDESCMRLIECLEDTIGNG